MADEVSCAFAMSKANSRWTAICAFFISLLATTKEMLVSEEPWAMAMMFTFSRPRTLKVRPAIPTVPRMFSPTTATMAISGRG